MLQIFAILGSFLYGYLNLTANRSLKLDIIIVLISVIPIPIPIERNSLPSKNFPCISMDMLQNWSMVLLGRLVESVELNS